MNNYFPRKPLFKTTVFAEKQYKRLRHKYYVTLFRHVFLNLFLYSALAALIVLNLYAIKWNNAPLYRHSKFFFVAIAILNGFSALVASLQSFFRFRHHHALTTKALQEIAAETQNFNNNTEQYKRCADPQFYLCVRIVKIVNSVIANS